MMDPESEMERRMRVEERATTDLQKAWIAFQKNRTPETHAEYLRALRALSELLTGR